MFVINDGARRIMQMLLASRLLYVPSASTLLRCGSCKVSACGGGEIYTLMKEQRRLLRCALGFLA